MVSMFPFESQYRTVQNNYIRKVDPGHTSYENNETNQQIKKKQQQRRQNEDKRKREEW